MDPVVVHDCPAVAGSLLRHCRVRPPGSSSSRSWRRAGDAGGEPTAGGDPATENEAVVVDEMTGMVESLLRQVGSGAAAGGIVVDIQHLR